MIDQDHVFEGGRLQPLAIQLWEKQDGRQLHRKLHQERVGLETGGLLFAFVDFVHDLSSSVLCYPVVQLGCVLSSVISQVDRCSSFCFCLFSCREEMFQLSWPFLICPLVPCCPIETWLCIIVSRYFSGGQLARAAQQRFHSSARHWPRLVLCRYLVQLVLQVLYFQEEWVHISL